MGGYSESMQRLMTEFAQIPGIGEKTAERCAYYILRASREEALRLAVAIRDVKDHVRPCATCFNLTEAETCPICADPARDHGLVCVVEQPRDLVALEKAGQYRGLYHVLMGQVAPLDDLHPEDLTVEALRARLQAGGVREVILATSPTFEGDATARHVRDALASCGVRITRLARGIPSGASLEYLSSTILADALDGRREV